MSPSLVENSILRERYHITNLVGQGGMGSIYRAEDLRLPGRLCAIKEVRPDTNAAIEVQEQAQAQFLQEASILAQLDHPNLPKVSDFFNQNDLDYLVMDFVPGQDLREIIQDSWENSQPLDLNTVMGWVEQIADALIYLHNYNPPVLHRDIKPANIKLTPDGRIKLVDFGLVKLMDEDEARTITVVQGRGSALYTPLEQYGGDSGHTDVRSDIYAIGATLYHLLTGARPPTAKERFLNPVALRRPHRLNDSIPLALSDTILWAMSMHPDDRPESIEQFFQVLFGEASRPEHLTTTPSLFTLLRTNQALLLTIVALFLIALLLTIL